MKFLNFIYELTRAQFLFAFSFASNISSFFASSARLLAARAFRAASGLARKLG